MVFWTPNPFKPPTERKISMKNNRRVKLFAWVMAAIMVFCATPLTAFAADGGYVPPVVIGTFKIEAATADISVSYQTMDGAAVALLSTADRNQSYQMVLKVKENDTKAYLPAQGEMLFELPSEIADAEGGSNGTISWTYNSENRMLSFSWAKEAGKAFEAAVTVSLGNVYDVYNAAVINGAYYRLQKTTVRTVKPAKAYKADTVLSKVDPNCEAEDFDFENLDITFDGITYVYSSKYNEEDPLPYYTVEVIKDISVVINKIGCINKSTGKVNWINDVKLFDDEEKTTGYHRDFKITFHDNMSFRQPLLHMLMIKGVSEKDYYKVSRGEIIAPRVTKYKDHAVLNTGEYTLVDGEADFSNIILTIKGEKYRYSPTELTGDFESYYTVELFRIAANKKINSDDTWFMKEEGWLPGAKESFGDLAENNNTMAFHADYCAVLHKGKPITERKVTISSDWPEGKIAYLGAVITLTAELDGFSENVTLQWEYSTDTKNWTPQPGANELTYTYVLDETTSLYYWRVVAEDAN
jgi:hypothetical protein